MTGALILAASLLAAPPIGRWTCGCLPGAEPRRVTRASWAALPVGAYCLTLPPPRWRGSGEPPPPRRFGWMVFTDTRQPRPPCLVSARRQGGVCTLSSNLCLPANSRARAYNLKHPWGRDELRLPPFDKGQKP